MSATRPEFELLAAHEERHFWFRARRRLVHILAGQVGATLSPPYRVLEVGCANGRMLAALQAACPGASIVGIDLFREGLLNARRAGHVCVVQADAGSPPFGEVFDLVTIFDVLEHLPDDAGALRTVRGLLSARGRLLLTVPAHPLLWSYADEAAAHVRRYTLGGLEQRLTAAGYRVDYMTHFMSVIAPLVWLTRTLAPVVARRRGWRPTSLELARAEFVVPPVVNRALDLACLPELSLLARRWRLRIGTSIAAIAHIAPSPVPVSTSGAPVG